MKIHGVQQDQITDHGENSSQMFRDSSYFRAVSYRLCDIINWRTLPTVSRIQMVLKAIAKMVPYGNILSKIKYPEGKFM